ncbi:MAG: sigma-54-dependent Fis family transcriptional regulator [Desulfatitalea sp.]|nr:sigma-54 dependent transcriptional regulator [Desulfatitalea sp.]NNJ99760.1 sigma-54-dependent Fis family transcriptional regulator [Desulfatitalea sp.]
MKSVLVITAKNDHSEILETHFPSGLRIAWSDCLEKAFPVLERHHHDMVFIDIDVLGNVQTPTSPEQAMLGMKVRFPSVAMVIMVPQSRIRQAVVLVKAGAHDYVTYPLNREEVNLVTETIARSILSQSELDYLRDRFWKSDALEVVQTKSEAMVDVFKKIRSVASTKTTVLLSGETGTGKSVLAKLIHQHSNRQKAQFISVHCGAIPDTLLESELFGHEKGAFTGAIRKKMGKFEIANGGTIFLDEIGTLTPSAQVKLLQVLQDGTFSHVGGEENISTNARVIAATNADLKQLCDEGGFRKDLYYRLNVFPIIIPPLRDRIEDLPYLADLFLKRLNRELQKDIGGLHAHVIEALSHYEWPGNVRELENLIERAYILENSSILKPESFPKELFDHDGAPTIFTVDTTMPLAEARQLALKDFERRYIEDLVTRNKGRINASAAEAGVSTRQLHKLMSKYGIRKEQYKDNGDSTHQSGV